MQPNLMILRSGLVAGGLGLNQRGFSHAETAMLKIGKSLFWLLVGLVVWAVFVVALWVMAVVDDALGFINRKFDELFGDW